MTQWRVWLDDEEPDEEEEKGRLPDMPKCEPAISPRLPLLDTLALAGHQPVRYVHPDLN